MFPLGSVLFPHMPLALRLFEPRYLQMLAGLLEQPQPEFAVVLIERGHEVGGGDHRFGLGTMARLIEVEAREEFMAIVAVGTSRVRVDAWLPDGPYPRAEVSEIEDFVWDEDLRDERDATESLVREALIVMGGEPDVELTDDPVGRCWQLAALAPVGPLDAWRLLGSQSLEDLMGLTRQLTSDAIDTFRLDSGSGGFD
ncbi:MAG: LON peptidase substrate-binding domain-containing protein [Actinobacteria bacterium]|jgi:Lon protease-like protein|nr:LON peptidase substrate-binding domain-containing protein [Actinomycetota bacterium]TXH40378.1 MAG: peptidase S16 [Actinomycetota bacterium]